MKHILILSVISLFISINLFSQDRLNSHLEDKYSQPVDMQVDVIHIKLNLEIEPYKQLIKGTEIISFKTLRTETDSLVFSASEIDFSSVKMDGIKTEFVIKGNETVVYFKDGLKFHNTYNLTVEFTGNPTEGLYFSGWNDTTNRHRKQIWAHSPQGWMPFINQKHDILTTEVTVKFDSKFKVFSNGDRIEEKDNGNGTKTWHYKMNQPHVIYLVCLAIGEYDYKLTKSKSGVPIELWYYPDLPENFEVSYQNTKKMMDFFEKEIGVKYPWGIYRQAPMVNYMYGGMETTTATVYGDYMYLPARAWWMRNYVNVNAHEMNHQWFGNLVSHLNNPHTWLTESFATYWAKRFEREINGEDYYQWERDKELTRTLNAAKINNNPVSHSQAGTDRWYPKGSLVLDMMRDVLGDTLFLEAIKYYTSENSHQVTETSDLLKSIRKSTGVALDWFFDQWLYRGGEPHFKVEYTNLTDLKGETKTVFNIEQIHPVDNLIGYFKVPCEVQVYYKDGTNNTVRVWIEGQKSQISVPNPNKKDVDFAVFDPNRKIIKKLTFIRSINELLSQAEKALNMIDRYDALLELRNFKIENKRKVFNRIFSKEVFHLCKAEIVKQLAGDSASFDLIKSAINDKDALVRRAVVENITLVPEIIKEDYKKLLKDSCFTNLELALRNLSASYPNEDYLEITKNETGWRGKNIRMAWLEISLGKTFSQTYLNELIDYSSLSFEFETRINALNTLIKLNIINQEITKNAIYAALHWNFKLRDGGINYLKYMYSQNKGKVEIENVMNNISLTEKQKTALESIKLKIKG